MSRVAVPSSSLQPCSPARQSIWQAPFVGRVSLHSLVNGERKGKGSGVLGNQQSKVSPSCRVHAGLSLHNSHLYSSKKAEPQGPGLPNPRDRMALSEHLVPSGTKSCQCAQHALSRLMITPADRGCREGERHKSSRSASLGLQSPPSSVSKYQNPVRGCTSMENLHLLKNG